MTFVKWHSVFGMLSLWVLTFQKPNYMITMSHWCFWHVMSILCQLHDTLMKTMLKEVLLKSPPETENIIKCRQNSTHTVIVLDIFNKLQGTKKWMYISIPYTPPILSFSVVPYIADWSRGDDLNSLHHLPSSRPVLTRYLYSALALKHLTHFCLVPSCPCIPPQDAKANR